MTGKGRSILLCMVLCLVPLSGCEKAEHTIGKNESVSKPEKIVNQKEIEVVEKGGDLCFANSLEEFIDCYNLCYCEVSSSSYIRSYSEWYFYVQDCGRHKGDMCYEFTADKEVWTLPTIAVYTPENETVIKELTVNFDDHSYTEKMYKQYEEMCFYTLKVFFPDLKEEELTKSCKKLNKRAYGNIFQNDRGFTHTLLMVRVCGCASFR